MKNSNKLLVAVALLALLPTALTLLLTIKRTNRTIELITQSRPAILMLSMPATPI